ncbi:uncharacterized protein LOC143346159 isoform X1 [Colletes latitarsis]|uniref:uncharacterized protein LOC143346159 isoform X1 n=1 Tax=Colletes latitarsis TaxID=2605962 RepID=UPI004035E669
MIKMGAIAGLLLLTLLCASVGRVQGECRYVENNDMVEYSCVGGQLSDLNNLPQSVGKILITDMPISQITRDTFSRFGPELWVLGLSHCGVTDIEPDAFRHLSNLQQLSLENNHLTTVKESWFRGLDYLTYLDLNYNQIHTIEDGVFKILPSLIELRLSGNRLECLNIKAMSHIKYLKRMFLTENTEFKCPNAVSTYLESRGVLFERDPEWNKIPDDLIRVEAPIEYSIEYEDVTSTPTTPLPTYRERLHPTPRTPRPSMESTPSYPPPRFHTTEEVVYRPDWRTVTPDWRTMQKPTTTSYEDVQQRTTMRPPYDPNSVYVPQRVVPPVDTTTDSPPDARQYDNLEPTRKPWPRFPESTSATSEFPLYPPRENEDRRFMQPYYPSEATNLPPLAPGPEDRHETPPLVESNIDHTAWPDYRPPEYRSPPTVAPAFTVNVRPMSPTSPEINQSVWPTPQDRSMSLENSTPNQGVAATRVPPIETTTDKPLPYCPNKNLSSSLERSFVVLVASVLLVFLEHVFVEGF